LLHRDKFRAGLAGDGVLQVGQAGDNRPPAAGLEKPDDPLNLRRHTARAEVPFRAIALRLVDGHAVERALVRLPEIQADLLHVGGDDEQIRAEQARQQRRGEILVNHRLDAVQIARGVTRHRNPSPADGRDDVAVRHQMPDGVQLDDAERLRAGHDTPPPVTDFLGDRPPVPPRAIAGGRFVLQGGTQRNLAAVKAQVDFIRDSFKGQGHEPEIALHPHCGEAGAIGAGLEAIRLWKAGRATTFIGLAAAEQIKYRTTCDDDTRCHFCTNDCLRTFSDVWKNSFSASSNNKVWAAKFAARHPNLVAVELSNFKCGHDSPIFSVIEEIVERSGTPFFAFKDLDENRPAGSIKLRLETIDYSLRRYQERLAQRRRAEARIGRWVGEYERRLRTRLEPDPSPDAQRNG